jgi:hypothetical protein
MKAYAASVGLPSVKRGVSPAVLAEEERCLSDLLDPWRSRMRVDREVTAAIKTAFYRGRQMEVETKGTL